MTKLHNHSTRQKLLAVALELFYKDGYNKASVNTIVQKAGVSKGAFYHYFTTKEEILDDLAQDYAEKMATIVNQVLAEKNLSGLDKFNQALAKIQEYKFSNFDQLIKLQKVIETGGDSTFGVKFTDKLLELVSKPFQAIIKQGIEEGSFSTLYPEEVLKFAVRLAVNCREEIRKIPLDLVKYPQNLDAVAKKLDFCEDALTKVMGAKKGTIKIGKDKIRDIYKKYGKKLQ